MGGARAGASILAYEALKRKESTIEHQFGQELILFPSGGQDFCQRSSRSRCRDLQPARPANAAAPKCYGPECSWIPF